MILGISDSDEKIIKRILGMYNENYEFYYYGSRVKGTFEKSSDLDILIKGNKEMPYSEKDTLEVLFDHSDLSFVVNFSDYYTITEDFYKLIEKDLVKVF